MRQRNDDPYALRYRNALCVRAHSLLIAAAPDTRPTRHMLADAARWPALIWPAIVLSFTLLLLGIVIGDVIATRNPEALAVFVPAELGYTGVSLDHLVSSPEARAEFLKHESSPTGMKALFGSFLFMHNTRIGMLSLATGMLGAIPTVLLQLYNGIMLGAFASIFLRDPWPISFFAWILPHGIPEMSAIALCAAAGLLLGRAVVAPGNLGVRAALAGVINPAIALAGLSLPLFAVAAIIEGFIRQSALGNTPRLVIAAGGLGLVAFVLIKLHRAAERSDVDTSWLHMLTTPVRSESRDTD